MKREIASEWLDTLLPEDPLARGSRRDLERLNAWMGNAGIMAKALSQTMAVDGAQRLAELGAGDGNFMLRVAKALPSRETRTSLLLLDRQSTASAEVQRGFKALGWNLVTVQADALGWIRQEPMDIWDAMAANLFLHHFSDVQLRQLFHGIAARARRFIAIEPRRSVWALGFSHLVGCIGCNRVTRHDAPISVRAGFIGRELSALWPADKEWVLRERSAGLFGHLFEAQRNHSG